MLLPGLAEYADVVVAAAEQHEKPTLVAQSMGAYPASMACSRFPARLLVLVNAMIPAAGETPGQWWANTGQEQAQRANDLADGRLPDAGFEADTYFLHDLPQQLIEQSVGHAEEPSDTPFAQVWPLDVWPDVPTKVLAARDDRFFPAAFQRRVAEERLGITPDEIPGGHLAPLSHPVALAQRLMSYHAD